MIAYSYLTLKELLKVATLSKRERISAFTSLKIREGRSLECIIEEE
jgi:hypothetical protein